MKKEYIIMIVLVLVIVLTGTVFLITKKSDKKEENIPKEKEEPKTEYKEYKKLDEITLSDGSKWLVIKDSSKTDDYVTVLSITPVDTETLDETINDELDYEFFKDGVANDYVPTSVSYQDSALKKATESIKYPFKLKEVDGYTIRLITIEELMELGGNWEKDEKENVYINNDSNEIFNKEYMFVIYTMSECDCSSVDVKNSICTPFYIATGEYEKYTIGHFVPGLGSLNPVINVYKTEIKE